MSTPSIAERTPEFAEGLARYLAERDRERAERIQLTYDALTKREQQLVREAAVMGFVRGQIYGYLYGRDRRVPTDRAMVTEVVDACLAMPDLYPVINRIARRAERRQAAGATP